MTFGAEHLLWMAVLSPIAAVTAWWCWRRRLDASARWAARGLWARLDMGFSRKRMWTSIVLLGVAVVATVVSLSQPQWGEVERQIEREGIDIVFILDTSLSMVASDVQPSRIYVARSLIRRLVSALPGHRVALVQAEGEPVVMAPLTIDGAVLDLIMDTAEPGSLPTPGTALAKAIELGLELFPEGGETHRAMILLSDGEDHGGDIDGIIEQLEDAGVVLHALGIGTAQGAPLQIPGGENDEYKRTAEGEIVVSQLHDEILLRLAHATDGLYLPVPSAATSTAPILSHISQMEKRTLEGESLITREERFQWPLGLSVLALAGYLAIAPFKRSRQGGAR